jgi:Phage capsid family
MASRTISALPAGTNVARYVQALIRGKGFWNNAIHEAERAWPESPEVPLTLKAAITALDTSEALASWGIARAYLDLLTGVSVVERLLPRMFRTDFGVKTPVGTVSPSVGWIGEGRGTPVNKGTLGSVTLDQTSVGMICVITNELARQSSPAAEQAIRTLMVNAAAKGLDAQFFNPAFAGVSMVAPASICYNAINRVSTGATSTAIAADLSVMSGSLTTDNDVVWVMRPATLRYLWAHNTDSILVRDGSVSYLLGRQVLESQGSPQQITLVDIGHIVIAEKGVEITATDQSTLQMSDAPQVGQQSPLVTSEVLHSLWQGNMSAIKIQRWIGWARAVTGSVVYMAVAY